MEVLEKGVKGRFIGDFPMGLGGKTVKRNIMLVLEYDGTRYDGWQKQGNTENTIQAKIEAVLSKWNQSPVEVHGSGRTDAGVHARRQTANFHIDQELCPISGMAMEYLNRYLPEDIRVVEEREVPQRFHSRLSADRKTYAYYVETSDKKQVFERKYVYGLGQDLNLRVMEQAAGYLVGQHDFKSFCANRKMKKSTVRRLDSVEIKRDGTKVVITYTGNGFLYHMVRIMTGTLLEVGLGKRDPGEMVKILNEKDRKAAGITVPPEGLFLMNVEYDWDKITGTEGE